jgi:hypothetical protein
MRASCACGGRIHPLEVRPADRHVAHFRCDKCGRTFRQTRRGPNQPRFDLTAEFAITHKYSVLATDTSAVYCSCPDLTVAKRIADWLSLGAHDGGHCVRFNPTGEIIY